MVGWREAASRDEPARGTLTRINRSRKPLLTRLYGGSGMPTRWEKIFGSGAAAPDRLLHQPVLLHFLVERHPADPQRGGRPRPAVAVVLQRPLDHVPLQQLAVV